MSSTLRSSRSGVALVCARLVKLIQKFKPEYQGGDSNWRFYVIIKRKWFHVRVKEYQDVYYFFGVQDLDFSYESKKHTVVGLQDNSESVLDDLEVALQAIALEQKNSWMAYLSKLMRSVPSELRYGIIPRTHVRRLIPAYRCFDQELGVTTLAKTVQYLKRHRFDRESIPEMTAQLYFRYCRVAYLANPDTFGKDFNSKMSGKALYKRWADGRDGGLKMVNPESPGAFSKWYDGEDWTGGHPWEIYRGGNSTHIDLSVSRVEGRNTWKVALTAFSSTRLAETCRIALALEKAKLPFEFNHQESYLDRLLEQDAIGVLPEGSGISYGWHDFPKEYKVYDCIYFSWFKDEDGTFQVPRRKISSLIAWLPFKVSLLK